MNSLIELSADKIVIIILGAKQNYEGEDISEKL